MATQQLTQLADIDSPFSCIGGHKEIIQNLRYIIQLPRLDPTLIRHKEGILLYGPPGVGKTLMIRELARAMGDCCFSVISGPELMSKYVGEAEKDLREIFHTSAEESLKRDLPSFIFFDEIDAILGNRDTCDTQFEVRFVNQFLSLVDGFQDRGDLIIIGATNRPHVIDPAAKRAGRFDIELEVGYPTKAEREEIIKVFIKKYSSKRVKLCLDSISSDFISSLSDMCDKYNGSDIEGLFKRGYEIMKKRCFKINEDGIFMKIDEPILKAEDLEHGYQEYKTHFERVTKPHFDYYATFKKK